MTRSRPLAFLAAAAPLPLVALTVAGCGGGGSSSKASAASPKHPSGPTATIGTASTGLGTVLVNSRSRTIYNGHPLYLYEGDSAAGDTNGQAIMAFGAAWFAVSPAGKQVSGKGSTSGSSNGY